ncbi:methyl-accepting chemotaxis protein [Allochromatium humboldtianum]|uniref:Methyl-accepting chemotaxis protein n=1 Tax=Allochromatium humboldtianum TaxID=504901 RepID=A0A850R3H5_9GAMM|nr:methyl-accepting chemotaxis protein [Allochromatium humboldtianum]NVZ07898.1 methyl-accepting chemotaxis protein [Allochromatium humboldtianum]
MWKNLTIHSRLMVAAIPGILLIGAALVLIAYFTASSMAQTLVHQTLLTKADGDLRAAKLYIARDFGQLSLQGGQLVDAQGRSIEGRTEMPDAIGRDLGLVFSLFARDGTDFVRVATSVRDANGRLQLGTRLGESSAAHDPLVRGERYVGESDILGEPHLTAYEPLHDAAGQVIGVFGLGIPKTRATTIVAKGMAEMVLAMGVALLVVIAVGILGILGIARMITGPIRRVTAGLREIAEGEGDLSQRLPAEGNNELAELARTFNLIVERIHEMVKEVAGVSTHLASAAEELSLTSGETSEQVHMQLSETDQVATAIHEMTATVEEVARHAADAAHAAQETDREAEAGSRVVEQTIFAIEALANEVEAAGQVITRLSDDSREIGAVLDVIRGVAAQTNLLALNAAIEAARAGEQGRGFAVVADEVRTLASRTQDSIQDIQDKIERVQSGSAGAVAVMDQGRVRAGEGVAQARQAGESLRAIAAAIARINDMNTQIASAAEEQSAVAEEINRNIQSLSQSVSQISDGATQAASASGELARLAASLQDSSGRFKI